MRRCGYKGMNIKENEDSRGMGHTCFANRNEDQTAREVPTTSISLHCVCVYMCVFAIVLIIMLCVPVWYTLAIGRIAAGGV